MDISNQVNKLRELREDGLLSEEEYQVAKKRLIEDSPSLSPKKSQQIQRRSYNEHSTSGIEKRKPSILPAVKIATGILGLVAFLAIIIYKFVI
ncbi:MAG: SHOCT domain-containing protein [Lentisphaeria bacterium]|nr:SHOCT domain-containing protein [Lentisphaeria bacterium]NQZ68946.1 SHOCT domain-containing protein [Lentisphaeria bacterium]